MFFMRNAEYTIMIYAVLPVTPAPGLVVEIRDTAKSHSCQEIRFHEQYQPFNGALGKRVTGLAQPCFKANSRHKISILIIPERASFTVPPGSYALHVVCKDVLWYAHLLEGMEHSDEEVLLFRIRKEFNVSLSAMMTDHRKTRSPVGASIGLLNIDKSPVHLVRLAWS